MSDPRSSTIDWPQADLSWQKIARREQKHRKPFPLEAPDTRQDDSAGSSCAAIRRCWRMPSVRGRRHQENCPGNRRRNSQSGWARNCP